MSSIDEYGSVEVRHGGGDERLHHPLATLIGECVRAGASDIHIDPTDGGYLLRVRVDGVVHTHEQVNEADGHRLLNQIKVGSGIELEHARHPAEGQCEYHDGNGGRYDVRATIVPTLGDEAAHLRMLTLLDGHRDLHELGWTPEQRQLVEQALEEAHGLVLVAGVTGSGKTTTQYALARSQDLARRIAVSIEDPVEFELPHLRQMEVDESRGMTMAEGLRVLLRMDPDIMMVGEVRDRESALTAAHAALGGRLVLATVHGRDAAAAVDAMHFRAVPYYILGGALRMVIVQNLIRRICPACATVRPLRESERAAFEEYEVEPPATVCEPSACEACRGRGYAGRTGVFEVVAIDDEMADFLARGPHQQQIRRRFREAGVKPLITSALHRVAEHTTSFDEVRRLHSRELATLQRLPEAGV